MTIDRFIRVLGLRLRSLFHGSAVDRELDDELQYHLEKQIAENVRRGMSPGAALVEARRALGNVPHLKEQARDTRGIAWAEDLTGDVRFALRSLRRAPVFTAAVIATLALGIGANTAMFTLLRGTLLKPLPNRDGDGIIYMRQAAPGLDIRNTTFSLPEIYDYRSGSKTLKQVADFSQTSFTITDADGHPTLINAGVVSGNYFDVMGLKPVIGRLTSAIDDGKDKPSVTVLSYKFWMEHFGGDPSVIGRTMSLDSALTTIIGVVQAAPQYPFPTDVLVNIVSSPHHLGAAMVTSRQHRMTEVFARLAPGHSVEQARAEIDRIASNMRRDHPDAYNPKGQYHIDVAPLREAVNERATLMFWLLMGAAAFVLLVACANVSNLTLMRGSEREREMVVRSALGAGQGRLRRLLLTENLLLALIGGVLGILVSVASTKLLTGFAAQLTPRAEEIGIDATVLLVALGTSVAAAIALSFIPSIGRQRVVVGAALAPASRRATLGRGAKRFQRSLVVVQLSMCTVLLTGAGLLLRTVSSLQAIDSGVRAENVLTIELPRRRTDGIVNDADFFARYEAIRARIAALPGVTHAALGSNVPLRGGHFLRDIRVESPVAGGPPPRADFKTADPDYFTAAGIPLLKGRGFTTADDASAPLVAIISRALARQVFGNEDPIGKSIKWATPLGRANGAEDPWRTIVGVVGDTHDAGLESDPVPALYQPFTQGPSFGGALIVHTYSDPRPQQNVFVRAIHEVAPKQVVNRVAMLEEIRDATVVPRRLNAMFVASFAALAFVIAIVGIVGVLASSVRSRSAELGIRMALGAAPERLRRMILTEGGVLIAIGIAIGVTGSVFTVRLLRGLLFGVNAYDPTTFSAAVALLAGVGIASCLGPARRAARVDPAVTLRAD